MGRMTRFLKIAALSLVGVAFLSAAAEFCPCPDSRSAKAGGHDCCTPGLRSADAKPCCGAVATVSTSLTAREASSKAVLAVPAVSVAALLPEPVALHAPGGLTAPPVLPSPPLILRI